MYKGGNHMEQTKKLLEAREKYLLQIKNEKEQALTEVPEGTLRLCTHEKNTQYYHRKDPKDFNGVYIREKDIELAQRLAQKDYDRKVLGATEKELNAIKKYLSSFPAICAEQIYQSLHKGRQKLITPICETDEEYVQNWEMVEYKGKEFHEGAPEFYTTKGERVRSKSELIIADLLEKEGVPYRYEYPIYLKGLGKIYPDFTVLNVRKRKTIYWEHLGMMDDFEYVERALKKIATYEQNGIFPGENLVLTYETRTNPINQKMIMLMIQHYLKD